MTSGRPLLSLAAPALVLVLAACSSSSSPPKAAPTGRGGSPAGCAVRDTTGKPGWVPHRLLPKGTFLSKKLASMHSSHRGSFIVPSESVAEVRHFIKTQWPREGYVLSRLHKKPQQFSGAFVQGPTHGTFLVQARCGNRQAILYLGFTPGSPSPTPS